MSNNIKGAQKKDNNKKVNSTKNINSKKVSQKKVNNKKKSSKSKEKIKAKKRNFLMMIVLFFIAVLLVFSTYAWLSTTLNVSIKNFSMVVSKNSGLSISLDGINFSTQIEVSEDVLINQLQNTYPNNTSQWSSMGLVPVSTIGVSNPNNSKFDVYASKGVKYKNRKKDIGYITTYLAPEVNRQAFSSFIAFDIFLKNETGSPVSDNIYLDYSTFVDMESDSDEEMEGLVNSARVGFSVAGTVSRKADVATIQNIGCNGNCFSIIYEPNSTKHTGLSKERAAKYDIDLIDGERFDTYASINACNNLKVNDNVSGSPNINYNCFGLQNTITEDDFERPLFKVPDGITKLRIYIWIEAQDIDSLETDSEGADISISISFAKDTEGYDSFNE